MLSHRGWRPCCTMLLLESANYTSTLPIFSDGTSHHITHTHTFSCGSFSGTDLGRGLPAGGEDWRPAIQGLPSLRYCPSRHLTSAPRISHLLREAESCVIAFSPRSHPFPDLGHRPSRPQAGLRPRLGAHLHDESAVRGDGAVGQHHRAAPAHLTSVKRGLLEEARLSHMQRAKLRREVEGCCSAETVGGGRRCGVAEVGC